MKEMTQLKTTIEEKREKLEQAVLSEEFDVYYPKSLELDNLIEKYLEKVQSLSAQKKNENHE